jgi:biopolymer transport protein ExbD
LIGGNTNADEKSNELNTNFQLIKVQEDGTIVWNENYDYGVVDLMTTIIANLNHTYTIGGYAKGNYNIIFNKENYKKNKPNTEEYILINIDQTGKVLWDKIIENEGEDILKKVIVTRDNGYILAGTNNVLPNSKNTNRQGNNDFWIVKVFDENQPVKELEQIIASPNPTSAFTNVVIGFPYEKGELMVYDLMGRQIQTQTVTQRMIPIDLSNQAMGIYIVSVKIGNENYTVKVIKE